MSDGRRWSAQYMQGIPANVTRIRWLMSHWRRREATVGVGSESCLTRFSFKSAHVLLRNGLTPIASLREQGLTLAIV